MCHVSDLLEYDKTDVATVTQDDINQAEAAYAEVTEAEASLERLIGTYETYGSFNIVRPDFSSNADKSITFERKAS